MQTVGCLDLPALRIVASPTDERASPQEFQQSTLSSGRDEAREVVDGGETGHI